MTVAIKAGLRDIDIVALWCGRQERADRRVCKHHQRNRHLRFPGCLWLFFSFDFRVHWSWSAFYPALSGRGIASKPTFSTGLRKNSLQSLLLA